MALPFAYKNSNLYTASKKIVYSCYALTQEISAEEKRPISEQIKKAALIAHTNITKALYSKKKKKKRKLFKIAMKAYVLVDAGLEMIIELGWATGSEMVVLEKDLKKVFNTLLKKRKK